MEQYKSVEKIQYMVNIYRVFLSYSIGRIQWNQVLFFEILDRLLPSDIDDLKKIVIYWRFCLVRAIIPVLSEPVFRLTLIHFDFA